MRLGPWRVEGIGIGLLQRSEFKSHWFLVQFFWKILLGKNGNKQKEAGVGLLLATLSIIKN